MLKKFESLDMLKNKKVLNSMHISYMFSQLIFRELSNIMLKVFMLHE